MGETVSFLPSVGQIWYVPILVRGIGTVKRHLFILDFSKVLEYRDCDTVVEALVMETGERYRIYLDVLEADGFNIDDKNPDYRRDMGL
jgi:hypothetical protein